MAYEVETCPVCHEVHCLCWNCGKCPSCVEHRGEFNCEKSPLSKCILCDATLDYYKGCLKKFRSKAQKFIISHDSALSFPVCDRCANRLGSWSFSLFKAVENKLSGMSKETQDQYGWISFD